MAEQQAELDRLGDLERKLLEREARRKNIDSIAARDNAFKLDSKDFMNKVKDEYEKGLIVLDGAMDEERKRQFEMIDN